MKRIAAAKVTQPGMGYKHTEDEEDVQDGKRYHKQNQAIAEAAARGSIFRRKGQVLELSEHEHLSGCASRICFCE